MFDGDDIFNMIVYGVGCHVIALSLFFYRSFGFLFLALTFTAHQRASDTLQLLSTGAAQLVLTDSQPR